MSYKTLLFLSFFLYAITGNTQSIIDSLEKALPSLRENEKVEVLKELAIEYYLISEFPTALDYFEKGIDLGKEINDKKRLAVLYYNRALLYNDVTAYEKAVENTQNALLLFKKVENELGEAAANNLLGAIFAGQDAYALALPYFKQCRVLNEKIGYEQGLAASILNIGSIHFDLKQLDSAHYYFQEALQVLGDSTLTEVGIDILDNIGKVHQARQEDEKALSYFKRAAQIAENSGDIFATLSPRLNMGLSYKNIHDFTKAESLCLQVLSDAKTIKAEANILDTYEVLAQVYEALGVYKKATEYLKKHKTLNATLFENNRRQQLVATDAKFNLSQKEQENVLLKKEQEWQQFWIWALGIGLFLLFVSFTIVFIQKIQQSKLYKTLVQKNLEVVASEQELRKANAQLKLQPKSKEKIPKYVDSNLSMSKKKDMIQAINKAMEENQLYLQANLNLNILAEHLESNRTYLSQIINQEFGKNFNTFVNEYRIREARQMLSSPDLQLTIEGVAQTVGFNSVPSFNTAFKKFTGVNPSFFMKSAKTSPKHP